MLDINKKHIVSIIMPLYNNESYVFDAIISVIKQTYSHWELLIIDDCSSDNSYEIALEFQKKDPRIKVFKTKINSGTAKARNLGIEYAKGHFLVFLDSDDLLDYTFLEEQLLFILQENAAIVTGGYRRLAKKSLTNFIPPEIITFKGTLNGNPLSCLTSMINLDLTGKHYFDEELVKAEDFLFWLEILKRFGPAKGNKKVLATYRILEGSKSRKKILLIRWMLLVYKKIGCNLIQRYHHLFRWMAYGIKKYRNVK